MGGGRLARLRSGVPPDRVRRFGRPGRARHTAAGDGQDARRKAGGARPPLYPQRVALFVTTAARPSDQLTRTIRAARLEPGRTVWTERALIAADVREIRIGQDRVAPLAARLHIEHRGYRLGSAYERIAFRVAVFAGALRKCNELRRAPAVSVATHWPCASFFRS